MKKQLLTALLLSTSMATFTEDCSAATAAERLAVLRQKAAARQADVTAKTAAIRTSADSITSHRQKIADNTDALTGNLDEINTGMDEFVDLAEKGKVSISDHATALNNIKVKTADMAATAKAIADSLEATISTKTHELDAAIRAGAADIEKRQAELQDLIEVHTTITGQVKELTGAVDTINGLLNTAHAANE